MSRIIEELSPSPEFRKRSVSGVRLFVRDSLIDIMTDHADEGLLQDSEVMGLIVGQIYTDDEGEYALATGTISAGLDADETSVRFDKADMEQLIDAIDELKEGDRIIGWYHSHLGQGCFMSGTDIATQNGLFGGHIGFAIVIDPELRQLRVFDSTLDDPKTIQIIIME